MTLISSLVIVSQVISSGKWVLPRGRHPILVLLWACLPSVPPYLSSSGFRLLPLVQWLKWIFSGISSTSRTWMFLTLMLTQFLGSKQSGLNKEYPSMLLCFGLSWEIGCHLEIVLGVGVFMFQAFAFAAQPWRNQESIYSLIVVLLLRYFPFSLLTKIYLILTCLMTM